jgi:hypothetical protein
MQSKINKEVERILNLEPTTIVGSQGIQKLSDYFNSRKDVLAKMYAVDGFKDFMEVLISGHIRDAVVSFQDLELLRIKQGQIISLKLLLARAKKVYENYNATNKGIKQESDK